MRKKGELRKLYILGIFLVALAGIVYASGGSVQIGAINLTIWDSNSTGPVYETTLTYVYANYTNTTDNTSIINANCTLYFDQDAPRNMSYNSSSGLYELEFLTIDVGNHTYNISCNKTGYPWLNVSQNITIPNRNPVLIQTIPDITIEEDGQYTLDLDDYFVELDNESQTLGWNHSAIQNITISINNNTGIMNITPDADFYGVRNLTIIAVDNLNATNSTNVTINVTNIPEVSLHSPANTSTYYSNNTIEFKILAEDDFAMDNCSIYINDTLLQTINNPNVSSTKFSNDTGLNNEAVILSSNLTKQISLTNANYNTIRLYLNISSGAGPVIFWINGDNQFNISPSDVPSNGGWLIKRINSSSLQTGGNNLTLNDPSFSGSNYFTIGQDSSNEYLIRLSNDLVEFDEVHLPEGNKSWKAECYNNQSQGKETDSWNLTILNSPPTTPTFLTPTSGTFDNEINITCNGSVDYDNETVTYKVEYGVDGHGDSWAQVFEGYTRTYTWNTTRIPDDYDIRLRCYANDGNSDSQSYLPTSQYNIHIEHPGSPSPPTSLTCDGSQCSGSTFNNIINLSCSGSNDTDSNFDYYFEAYYESWNGSSWHAIGNVPASNGNNGTGNYTWDTQSVMNQTNMSVRCYADDGTSLPSSSITENNIKITHTGNPSIPSNLQPQSGSTFNNEINVSCNGSTGQGSLIYQAYAYYKSGWQEEYYWHELNTTLIESDVFNWNVSSIPEQSIDLKCRAYNSTYYSDFSQNQTVSISRAPTTPTTLVPETNSIHEHAINYSCTGSNNSNNFSYEIKAYYDSGSGKSWNTLTQDFQGITPVNDSEMAYEDGSYDYIDQRAALKVYRTISINVSNGNYSFCIKGYGTGESPQFKLYWNCDSNLQDSTCTGSPSMIYFASSLNEHCEDITLTKTGLKYLQILTNNPDVLGRIQTYIDHAYLVAKPYTLDVSGLSRQTGVNFTCFAMDEAGNSSEISTSNISIDRIPDFNTTKKLYYVDGTAVNTATTDTRKIRMKERTTHNNLFNIANYFSDEDLDSLTYSTVSNTIVAVTINQTTGNVSITSGSVLSAGRTEQIQFTANDNITTGYSPNITIEVYDVDGSSSGKTKEDVALAQEETNPVDLTNTATPTTDKTTTTTPPTTEQPTDTSGGSKKNDTVITSSVVQSVFNTKIKHTRKFFISRSKTKIVEVIKNIGFYSLEDVKARITIPKSIEDSASDIEMVIPFEIIEEDPVIEFTINSLLPEQDIELTYIIDKRLNDGNVDDIIIEIVPRKLTQEEIDERERKVQQQIENTSQYVEIDTTFERDLEKETTKFKIGLDIDKGVILYDVSVFAEIPKCMLEILEEENIESDIDFEIINEDPLIRWHFDKLDQKEEITYLLHTVADENCTNQMNVMPLAHKIALLTSKVNPINAFIPLLIIPILVFMITFFSSYGFDEKEKISQLIPTISWARSYSKKGYSWDAIKTSLRQTKKYSEEKIDDIIKFSSNLPRLLMTRLDINIEEGIVAALIILNIFDFLKLLPGEIEFAKVIISWTILGYVLFHASITNILFGNKSKNIDLILLISYFMLVMKNLVGIAKAEFLEAGYMKDLYLWLANNAYVFETILFMIGVTIIILMSVYIASRKRISRKSFMGAIGEFGETSHSIFKTLWRSILVFLAQMFFFIVIFNLMMEWLAVAVDAALLTAAIVFYLFVLIKHREKHWLTKTMYKIGNVGEKFYENFVELFHNRKTIFIGLTGMLMLHTLTEIGIFMVPYVLGIYNPLYLASWQAGHSPIFNSYGWLRGILGIAPHSTSSLFAEGAAGMGLANGGTLFMVYLLNIIAILFLLSLHSIVWYHLYKHRKERVSEVPKLMFSKFTISLFISSILTFILAGAFKLKGLYFKGLLGVDILTQNIAHNPNLDMILALSIAIGLLAYLLMTISSRLKSILNWTIIVISFGFFFRYLSLFFVSITTYYSSTIAGLTNSNPFISAILLIFMAITFIFYSVGIISLGFELWLRDELGLRRIIRIKNLPESIKHFDMGYIHHESSHKDEEHGKKHMMLKQYFIEEMRRDHKFSTILMHLTKVGWSDKAIDNALHELKENPEFRKKLSAEVKNINAKAVAALAQYIEIELNKGMHLKDIISSVIKRGWKDIELVEALLIINIK